MQENVNKVASCARFFSMRAFAHNRRSGLRGLISKFVKSQTWKQIITVQILSNISRSKHSQAMKFGQLIKYNVRNNFFLKNHTGNEARRLVLDLFFFFLKKLCIMSKKVVDTMILIYFGRPPFDIQKKDTV